MPHPLTTEDLLPWDWLPEAALEIESYLKRLVAEPSIHVHVIMARPKAISSFLDKCRRRGYSDPVRQVTDTVAVRIITFSLTERDRVLELVRERFDVAEDRNPGDDPNRDPRRRGYDCHHLVITGEKPGEPSGWLTAGGALARYFDLFGGLEVQIRTVAAHAWAEYEHAKRYKGTVYAAVSEQDKFLIDQLFGAAADARRALDEIFVAIDHILANPSSSGATVTPDESGDAGPRSGTDGEPSQGQPGTPIDPKSLAEFLAARYPDDEQPSDKGVAFALELVQAMGIRTIEGLGKTLPPGRGGRVRQLMDTNVPVTTVRRLDDELLARFGEEYIEVTGLIGNHASRRNQLEWRYDRLRGKLGDSTPDP